MSHFKEQKPAAEKIEYSAPPDLFQAYDDEFSFDLDVAANEDNYKCPRWFGPGSPLEEDGLTADWGNSSCWMFPPGNNRQWVRKALMAALQGATVVALLPADTSTSWFHDYILGPSGDDLVEIQFVRGRLKMPGAASGSNIPTIMVIFRPPQTATQKASAAVYLEMIQKELEPKTKAKKAKGTGGKATKALAPEGSPEGEPTKKTKKPKKDKPAQAIASEISLSPPSPVYEAKALMPAALAEAVTTPDQDPAAILHIKSAQQSVDTAMGVPDKKSKKSKKIDW